MVDVTGGYIPKIWGGKGREGMEVIPTVDVPLTEDGDLCNSQ